MAAYDGKWIVSKLDVQLGGSGALLEGARLTIVSATNSATVSITKGDGTTASFTINSPTGNELAATVGNLSIKVRYIPRLDILTGWVSDSTAVSKSFHVFDAVRSPIDGDWLVFAVVNAKGSALIKEGSKLTVDGDNLAYYQANASTPTSLTVTHNLDTVTKAYSTNSVRLGARLVTWGNRQYLVGNIGDADSPLYAEDEYAITTDTNTDTFIAVKIS